MIQGSVLFWGFVVRTLQALAEASPTILCGFVVAGVLRRMAGPDGTRRAFGGGGWRGLLRAWGIGMLLPVCALGVIPIAREMRRAGVPSGTILAFVLAAPHINPLSLLYGLTLSSPLAILGFGLCSLIMALGAGAVWDMAFAKPGETVEPPPEPMPPHGLKRLTAVMVAAAREACGPSMLYILAGLVGTGLLSAALPFGMFGNSMHADDVTSPLVMTAVAVPAYNAPLQGMMVLGLMFDHANSVGAAFVLYELGIGINVGLIVWLAVVFRPRRTLAWLGMVTALAVILGYALEIPFAHSSAGSGGHTHAFDGFSNPFPSGSPVGASEAGQRVGAKVQVLELFGLAGIGLLLLLGGLFSAFDRQGQVEAWLTRGGERPLRPNARFWERPIPGPALVVIAAIGLLLFSIVGVYQYYVAPAALIDEMVQVKADAVVAARTGNRAEAARNLERLDTLARRAEVGSYLRNGRVNPAARKRGEDFRLRIEAVRDAVRNEGTPVADIQKLLPPLEASFKGFRRAFVDGRTEEAQPEGEK
jgi:uncharacterized membrane protein YraQ (UPF0718 family)